MVRFGLILLLLAVVGCSSSEEPVTETGLTRDEVMKMAEENIKGNVSDEELQEHGISVTLEAEGDEAAQMLLNEAEAEEPQE